MQLDQLGLTFCFNNFFVSHIDMIILSTKKKKKKERYLKQKFQKLVQWEAESV